MDEEREMTLQIITASQVADAKVFYAVLEQNPLLANFMLEQLLTFLTNDYFVPMERRTVLIRFLEMHTNIDIIKRVLEEIDKSELKDDYTKIIMEWTYRNSQKIMQQNLAKFDGAHFCEMDQPFKLKDSDDGVEKFLKEILNITVQLQQENSKGDENDEGDEDDGGETAS